MTLDEFITEYQGQSVLYNKKDETLRGQCVQLVCYYATQVVGSDVMWADAVEWWDNFSLGEWYDKVPYPGNSPQVGDIVVFNSDTPGSAGAGHIDVCIGNVTDSGYDGFDSNWAGKTAHTVHHTYQYVKGFLRPKKTEVEDMPNSGDAVNFIRADKGDKDYNPNQAEINEAK